MFRLGDFTAEMVDPKEPLVLLLTMTDSTFMGVVNALFEVFGEEVRENVHLHGDSLNPSTKIVTVVIRTVGTYSA